MAKRPPGEPRTDTTRAGERCPGGDTALPQPPAHAVEELARSMADDRPVTEEDRALARAQLQAGAGPAPPAEAPLDRATLLQLIADCDPDLGEVIRDLEWAAENVGPAVGPRLAGIAGLLRTAAFDLNTLRMDIRQGNFPSSLAPDPQLELPVFRRAA